jgi:TrmH family RNA methyltransferase
MLTVVLVEPELPANAGFVARTMACFGEGDLRIVGRPGIAAHAEARRTASGGETVLEAARDFPDLDSAVGDCALALGFSRRARDPAQRILDLPEAVALRPAAPAGAAAATVLAPTALVFGCESRGLSRDQVLRLSHVVRIPLRDPVLSLNLSHAVAIALHAFAGAGTAALGSRSQAEVAEGAAVPDRDPSIAAATQAATLDESRRVLASALDLLADRGLLKPAKAEAQRDYLRILWQRLQPTRPELEFLAGLIRKLSS